MVKLKTICRIEKDYTRETKQDINKVFRNTNPTLHQFQKPREYQRALVSTKMDKIFAKPFLGALTGHSDGVVALSKSPTMMTNFLSGSFDGEIKFWDLSQRKSLFSINAHAHFIKGLTFSRIGQNILSCFLSTGDDKCVNLYELDKCLNGSIKPSNKFISKVSLGNISHSYKEGMYATSGQIVQIWNYDRSLPVQNLEWGSDSVLNVKFNPSEPHLLASTGIDRSVVLYDLRGNTPIKKNILCNKSNAICWNPQEPINFTVGNDDSNLYSFDMRKLENVRMIHKDHIGPVMDLDYSPTGKEFVTGSYDRTIRIFSIDSGRSREAYHGQRMQKVFSVCWSQDNENVISGSEDMNIRIWKSKTSKPLGHVSDRHKNALNYRDKLKDKFKHNIEIKRIARHQHLPKYIHNANAKRQIQKESKYKKIRNQEINNPNVFKQPKSERVSKIVKVEQ